ncbi:MAG: hypothetical protein KGL39_33615 [Patescibacteria group bacterium]|nr:hypothetical protein [Patescibacteria group bacterium]
MASKNVRFIALTTDDLRQMLESAWDAAPEAANSLFQTLKSNELISAGNAAGGVSSQSNNGHSAAAFFPGENRPSDAEITCGWRQLIDLYRKTQFFLLTCNKNAQDAFTVANQCQWGNFLTVPANPAVLVDPNGNWQMLCDKYMTDYSMVIGKDLSNETAIWLWMMESLQPVYESRANRTGMILAQGGYVS